MQGDEGFSVVQEIQQDTMQNKNIDKRPLFEKVLTGGCIATFGASLASEFIFTMTNPVRHRAGSRFGDTGGAEVSRVISGRDRDEG
jgi:hypothetical protein